MMMLSWSSYRVRVSLLLLYSLVVEACAALAPPRTPPRPSRPPSRTLPVHRTLVAHPLLLLRPANVCNVGRTRVSRGRRRGHLNIGFHKIFTGDVKRDRSLVLDTRLFKCAATKFI